MKINDILKNILLSVPIILSVFILLSCNKSELITNSEFDGNYEGSVTILRQYSFNGSLSSKMKDTFDLSVSIWNFKFERPFFGEGENCTGTVEIEEDKISLASEGCPCFCQCDPLVDCDGDLILGQYHFELQENLLKMWNNFEIIDSLSVPGIVLGYSGNRYFELYKK